MAQSNYKLNLRNATALVISNMIGTGVFTSLGYQVMGIKSVFAIIVLWLLGGIVAICGSLNYGELAVALPRSGGEYNYLSRIYHPLIGFLSGFVSATVGFAAPIALSAMAFGKYAQVAFGVNNPMVMAILLVIFFAIFHLFNLKWSGRLQTTATILNIILILILIASGFIHGPHNEFTVSMIKEDWDAIFSSSFAVSLVYVSFAYSGWNAAIYIAGEISNPERNLTKSLTGGTIIVMALYVLLNIVFMMAAPFANLSGQLEVAYIAANTIFGNTGSSIIAFMICIALSASVSAMIMFGPKVMQTIGEDFSFFKVLAKTNRNKIPYIAILIQCSIAILLIVTSTFEAVLSYIGITLSIFTTLVVAGALLNRFRKRQIELNYKSWGAPYTAIVFLSVELWMIYYVLQERTLQSLIGLSTILIGTLIYFLAGGKLKNEKQ